MDGSIPTSSEVRCDDSDPFEDVESCNIPKFSWVNAHMTFRKTSSAQLEVGVERNHQYYSLGDGIGRDIFSANSHGSIVSNEAHDSKRCPDDATKFRSLASTALVSADSIQRHEPEAATNTSQATLKVCDAETKEVSNPAPEAGATALPTSDCTAMNRADEASPRELTTQQAVSTLIDCMLENSDDPALLMRAMRSMRRLSAQDEGRRLIGDSGGVQIVTDCMKRFHTNPSLVSCCCMVISNLCYGPGAGQENKEKVQKSRALELLVQLLTSVALDDHLVFVCLAIRNVSNGSQGTQVQLANCGAFEGLYKVMTMHKENLELQSQAAAAVGNIANGNKTCQMRCRESGVLDLTIDAMRNHNACLSLLEYCILALRNMCAENARNQTRIGELGGVDEIVTAMRRFPRDAGLQARACAAIRFLAYDSNNRRQLGMNGGVVAIIAALDVVGDDVEQVCKALGNVTFDNMDNKLTVAHSGMDGLIYIVSSIGSSEEAVLGAIRVLRNITDSSRDVRFSIRSRGTIREATNCVERWSDNAGVSEQAFALLLNLYMDDAVGGCGNGQDVAVEDPDAVKERTEVKTLASQQIVKFSGRKPEGQAVCKHGNALLVVIERVEERERMNAQLHDKLSKRLTLKGIGGALKKTLSAVKPTAR
jgi:hypothetical protein